MGVDKNEDDLSVGRSISDPHPQICCIIVPPGIQQYYFSSCPHIHVHNIDSYDWFTASTGMRYHEYRQHQQYKLHRTIKLRVATKHDSDAHEASIRYIWRLGIEEAPWQAASWSSQHGYWLRLTPSLYFRSFYTAHHHRQFAW